MTKYWTIFMIMAFSVFTGIWYLSRPKFCYVNLKEVFENFTFTKKLRGDLMMVKSARMRQLDSLHFELELISKKLNSKYSTELATLFQKKRNEYITKEEEILAYLVDFGKENNYDMVFGTESLGTILYARDRFDATLEATKYINIRFSSNIK
jgi:Skp family chaperone for outer membrane proteins